MPYPGTTFKKHNKKLKGGAARRAGRMAEAMERSGVPEGESIATANKYGDKLMRKGRKKK